jgi:hypothetical protein
MFYAITDTLLKVSLNTNKTGHHVIPDTLLKVVINKTAHSVLLYTWHIVESVVKTPIKLVTMFYVIPDTLLKVSLNTNKTGHHVLRYTWHIDESVVKHQ